ncbi:PrgI family protein [Streptococcus equi]|uniref:PrgI family protein n=1 Tax=Streptococcus equi TaxID=1336 RepID=UPI0013DD42C5|nr:PrgI family protein [Streptococcus equi]
MLSVTVHKDIAEYQPKVVGKMTLRTIVSLAGALGSSILTGLYIYFVLGLNVGDYTIIIYAISLPFWLCGFFRPKGLPFEQFFPLWLKAKLKDDRIFYIPSFYLSGVCDTPKPNRNKKGNVYEKYYRKERNLNGIESYSARAERVIS